MPELAPNSKYVKDTEEVSLRTQIQSDSELEQIDKTPEKTNVKDTEEVSLQTQIQSDSELKQIDK